MQSIWEQFSRQLSEREALHLMRQRVVVESAQGARVVVEGKPYLCFCSNDYLGLASHPKAVEAFRQAASQYGVGSGASHLVCGHGKEHHLLEEEFATITGRDRALLFSSGYMANLGVVTALCDKPDAILEDRLNHASLIDAALLSGARFQRYLHNDMGSLQGRLEKVADARRKLLCVDGVFSMDGDLAPLPELAAIARKNDAVLMVDDAHGFGVLGRHGLGSADHFSLSQQDVPVLMCTLGKALGSCGAIVAGPDLLVESLIQFARPYIYTTALPPAVAAATRASLRLLAEEGWLREKLAGLIRYFRSEAANIGLPLMESVTAIQPLLLGDELRALQWQQRLMQQGIWISAIRPPTVPRGTSRLRVTLSAAHSTGDIDQLLGALAQVNRELPVQGES